MAKQTPKSNFTEVDDAEIYRLIVNSTGLEKTGKNHFGFTGPGPIYGLYFDPGGVEGVAQKFKRGDVKGHEKKEILQTTYRYRKNTDDQAVAKEVIAQFEEDYQYALKNARTIQWDDSELWEAARFAEFGRESSKGQFYGPLNAWYRGLVLDAYEAGVNLQIVQKVKRAWVDDAPSDTYEGTGFKGAGYLAQVNLRHTWDKENGFGIFVESCRQNMAIAGETFYDCSWAELGQYVFPDSDEGDWQ